MRARTLERCGPAAWLALLAALAAPDLAAQQQQETRSSRPDSWFIATSVDEQTREPVDRLLYVGRDGTVVIVQCAERDGERTGGWSVMIRRDDWFFRNEFLEGWWSVDGEPEQGPLRWGGSGAMVLLNEEALKERLQRPVQEAVRLRIVQTGGRQWSVELLPRDLTPSVERFAPTCQTT
ncbi:MAG TPA: hypothetical protein VFQ22_12205 [Longimicrobiales bacterium]|nr:hypothetical protein [Longimicrobiales bacterium]